MNNHYKNNGEQCCQICLAYMTKEEYDFCDICDDCREEINFCELCDIKIESKERGLCPDCEYINVEGEL